MVGHLLARLCSKPPASISVRILNEAKPPSKDDTHAPRTWDGTAWPMCLDACSNNTSDVFADDCWHAHEGEAEAYPETYHECVLKASERMIESPKSWHRRYVGAVGTSVILDLEVEFSKTFPDCSRSFRTSSPRSIIWTFSEDVCVRNISVPGSNRDPSPASDSWSLLKLP